MRAVRLLASTLAATMVLSAAGCGISGEAADAPTTPADLRRALLTPAEVGNGFTVDPDPDDDSESGFDVSGECRRLVDQFEARDEGHQPLTKLKLENTDTRATLLASLDFADRVPVSLDEYLRFVRRCGELPFDDDSGTMRVSAQRVEDLGDDALRLSVEIEIQEPTLRLRATGYLWIHDDVAAQVIAFDGVDEDFSPIPLPNGFARSLADKADRKLTRVLGD